MSSIYFHVFHNPSLSISPAGGRILKAPERTCWCGWLSWTCSSPTSNTFQRAMSIIRYSSLKWVHTGFVLYDSCWSCSLCEEMSYLDHFILCNKISLYITDILIKYRVFFQLTSNCSVIDITSICVCLLFVFNLHTLNLQSFQKEITLNTERIDRLIVFGESLIQKSSPQDAALIEDELEELYSYCQGVFSRLVRFHQRLSQPVSWSTLMHNLHSSIHNLIFTIFSNK